MVSSFAALSTATVAIVHRCTVSAASSVPLINHEQRYEDYRA
ncbi:hypothetical protein [Roseiflexus sp.]|nr:hypothetical protein [Roseiflexus sp.]